MLRPRFVARTYRNSAPCNAGISGGAYAFVSEREGESIASVYFAEGYNCFVLRYITGEKAAKNKPLIDAAAAIAHIRKTLRNIISTPKKVAVIGFSAGGHLAGYIATSWHLPFLSEALGEIPAF
jgi:acetyl esterase/lipase